MPVGGIILIDHSMTKQIETPTLDHGVGEESWLLEHVDAGTIKLDYGKHSVHACGNHELLHGSDDRYHIARIRLMLGAELVKWVGL
jgi:hypothetical protein